MVSDFTSIPQHKFIGASPPPSSERHHPVVIVGGGPVGLTLALDLGHRGHEVVVLNQLDFIADGSKAICFSKRTLEVWNRLGVAQRMVEKGVVWNVGKVFHGHRRTPVYQFDLRPEKGQEMPGFINLQQYWVEQFLVDALAELENVDLRWGHQVTALDAQQRLLTVSTAQGDYALSADWIVACDGARSPLRHMLGLRFDGRVFEDNFLIADVRLRTTHPAERWFWFDPPWGGSSALLHKQPDDVWRLDFQLGWDIDREAAKRPENVEPLVRGMLGEEIAFEPVWYSVYTFQCRRMNRFVHDRVIFAGDAAHLVSPFGARGCNGGVADADNLAWKLSAVLGGASPQLIDTYNEEAVITADENILNSTRSTDFMTPKSAASLALRDAVLALAADHPFARPFVNSGRLSTPVHYPQGALVAPDRDAWAGGIAPGSPAVDARLGDGWLLNRLGGQWKLLTAGSTEGSRLPEVVVEDEAARARYDLTDGAAYLLRPDQYVAARWKQFVAGHLEDSPWARFA
ncbi:MAG: FAD-dependent monooxygenase [Pseudomonadota bacterium]